jgi:hypothetical protein
VGVLVDTKDKKIWKVSEPGTFAIQTFGGSKFAGTFSFKIASILDSGPASTAAISGSFDLSCTGSACS